MSRRLAGLVTAVAVLALLAGSGAAAAPSEGIAPGPVNRLVKADNQRAKATVLRAGDVYSNFVRDRSLRRAPTIAHCGAYPGDRSDITVTGEARSAFTLNSYSIGSAALWFRTTADADRYWRKTVRARYVTCLAERLEFADAEGGVVKPRIAQAARIPLRPTGAEKAVAYRVTAQVTGPGLEPFTWLETAVFVKSGRGIALLRTIWINDNCDCYHGLARVLAKRLKAVR
jgi:hypothetical protein